MSFYAVANGRVNGVFRSWTECSNSVKGFKNAIYKKFDGEEDAIKFSKSIKNDVNINTVREIIINSTEYYVYTDGSCYNNGKKNAVSGIGIFFGPNDERNVSKTIEGKQTNNTAELTAIIETYSIIEADILAGKKIGIVSDSEYAIKSVSSYGKKCSKCLWDVDIPNQELVKTAYELYKNKPNVEFIHVKAHTNSQDIHSIGNTGADILAGQASSSI